MIKNRTAQLIYQTIYVTLGLVGCVACLGIFDNINTIRWDFPVLDKEIEDVSLSFGDTKILQAIFSTACIVDYKKNQHTSEIAYNGKTIDIVHISTTSVKAKPLSNGTLSAAKENDPVYASR